MNPRTLLDEIAPWLRHKDGCEILTAVVRIGNEIRPAACTCGLAAIIRNAKRVPAGAYWQEEPALRKTIPFATPEGARPADPTLREVLEAAAQKLYGLAITARDKGVPELNQAIMDVENEVRHLAALALPAAPVGLAEIVKAGDDLHSLCAKWERSTAPEDRAVMTKWIAVTRPLVCSRCGSVHPGKECPK